MKLILTSFLFFSCATSAWVEIAPSFDKQRWRICTKELDGGDRHLKGLCYISKEVKRRTFRSDLVRPKINFCAWEDKDCLTRHAYSGKRLQR